ncbi:MAG TPA: 30S ribosomal protein S2 [Patescibacteria group bacterium]|nr:30S ribosomal protein S2 [Patescibacteria group bacterium]
MKNITLEELLEAGCHFGHQVTRQNPRAREFVFEARDGIHIIDLAKTKEGLDEALLFIKSIGEKNGSLLVVGTKRQAQPIVEEETKRAQEAIANAQKEGVSPDLFVITKRWTGGLLTNHQAVEKNFKRLKDLAELLKNDEARRHYTKKELGLFEKEKQKLESFYSGVADMKTMPSVIFVVDTHLENLAVREANRMNIPVVGIVDTNADPDPIQYVIPANDDAVGSIKLLVGAVMNAWVEGKLSKKAETKSIEKKEIKPAKEKSVSEAADVNKVVQSQKKTVTHKKKTSTKDVEKEKI